MECKEKLGTHQINDSVFTSKSSKTDFMEMLSESSELSPTTSDETLTTIQRQTSSPSQISNSSQSLSMAQILSPKTYDVNNDPATDDLMKDILYEIGVTVTNKNDGSNDSQIMTQNTKDSQTKSFKETLQLNKGLDYNEKLLLAKTNVVTEKDDKKNEEILKSLETELEGCKSSSIGNLIKKTTTTKNLTDQNAEKDNVLISSEIYPKYGREKPFQPLDSIKRSLASLTAPNKSHNSRTREIRSHRSTLSSSRITIGEVLSKKVPISDVFTLEMDKTMLGNEMNDQDGPGGKGTPKSSTSLMTNISELRPTSPSYPPPPQNMPITFYPLGPTHTPVSFQDPMISSSHVPISFVHGPTSPTHPPPDTIMHPSNPSHPHFPYSLQTTMQPSSLSLHHHVNFNDIEFLHHPRSPTHPPPNPVHGPSSPTYPPPNFLHGPISPTHPPPDLPPLPIGSIHSQMYPPQSFIRGPSSPIHPPPNPIHGPSSPTHPPPPISAQHPSSFLHEATPHRPFLHPPSVSVQQSHQSNVGILPEGANVSSEPTSLCENNKPQNVQWNQTEQTNSNITQKTAEEGSQLNKRGKVCMTVGMSDLLTFTFQHEHFPTSVNMARLAKMMGSQWAQVRNWFTNRRLENKKAGVNFRDKTLNYCPYCRIHLKAPKEQKAHLFDPEHIKNVLGLEFQGSKDDPDTKKKIFWKKFPDGVDTFSKISGGKILAVGHSAENGSVKSEEILSEGLKENLEDLKETVTKDTNMCNEVKTEVKQETSDVKQKNEEFIASSLNEEKEGKLPTSDNIHEEENQSTTEDITMTYISVNKRMAGGKVSKSLKVVNNQESSSDNVLKEKVGFRSGQEVKQKDLPFTSPRTKADMREDLRRSENPSIGRAKYEHTARRENIPDDKNRAISQSLKSKAANFHPKLPPVAIKYHKESKIKPEGSQLYRKALKQSMLCHEDYLIVGYQCPNCPKVFHTEWMMMKHSLTHFEYQCGICENSFDCLPDLKNHLHEHLTLSYEGDYYSQFSCNVCRSLKCGCYDQNICKPSDTAKYYSKPQTAKRSKKTFITKPNTGPNDHLKVTMGSYKRTNFPSQYKDTKGFRKPNSILSPKSQSDVDNDLSTSKQRFLKNIQPLPNENNIQKQSSKIYASVSKTEEFVVKKDEENSRSDFSKENFPIYVPRTNSASNSKDNNKKENLCADQKETDKQNTSSENVYTSLVPKSSEEVTARKKRGRKTGGINSKNIYKDADYYYLCEMCDSTFLSKAELNEHMFFHRLKSRSRRGDKRPIRGGPLEGSDEPDIKKVKVDKDVETIDIGGFERFKCPLCKGHFASIQDLNRHRTQAHAQQDEIKTAEGTVKVLKCSYCDKVYRREREFLRHLKHGCKGTPKELIDQLNEGQSLYTIKNNSVKPPFTMVLQDSLSAGTPVLNTQEGPVVCLYCGKVVKRMREMKRHVSMFCQKVPKAIKIKVNRGVSLLELGFQIMKKEINSVEVKDHNDQKYNESIVIKDEPVETVLEPPKSEIKSKTEEKTKSCPPKSLPKNMPQQSKWEKEALRSMKENSSGYKTFSKNSVPKAPYRYGKCPYCKMFYTKQYILNHVKEKCPDLSNEDKYKIKDVALIEQAFEILNNEKEKEDTSEAIILMDDSPVKAIKEEETPEEQYVDGQYVSAELDKDDEDYDPVEDARENHVSLIGIESKITESRISPQGNTCKKCGESFSNQAKLIAHTSVHHGPKKGMYRCKLCNAKLQKYRHLREHVWEHTNESPYRCHVCKSHFRASDSLILHLNTHHKYFEINEKNLFKWLPGKYGRYRTITDLGGFTDSTNLSFDEDTKSDSENLNNDSENLNNSSESLSNEICEKEDIEEITGYDIDMVILEITKTDRIKLPGNKHVKISASDSKMLIEGLLQTKRDLINMRNLKRTNSSDGSDKCIDNNTKIKTGDNVNLRKCDNVNDNKSGNHVKDKVENKIYCSTSKSPRRSLTIEDNGELMSTLDALDSVVETVQIKDSDLS